MSPKPKAINDKSPSSVIESTGDEKSKNVIPWKMNKTPVIPGNVANAQLPGKITRCTVDIEHLGDTPTKATSTISRDISPLTSTCGYTMRTQQPPKKVTHRTSGHKRSQIDYIQFDVADEPSSPPKKWRKVDLKRRPTKTRIAAEKYKTKLLGGPRLVRNRLTVPKSTSTATPITMTPSTVQPSTSRTVTVAATKDKTQTAISALLSLSEDLSQ